MHNNSFCLETVTSLKMNTAFREKCKYLQGVLLHDDGNEYSGRLLLYRYASLNDGDTF